MNPAPNYGAGNLEARRKYFVGKEKRKKKKKKKSLSISLCRIQDAAGHRPPTVDRQRCPATSPPSESAAHANPSASPASRRRHRPRTPSSSAPPVTPLTRPGRSRSERLLQAQKRHRPPRPPADGAHHLHDPLQPAMSATCCCTRRGLPSPLRPSISLNVRFLFPVETDTQQPRMNRRSARTCSLRA
jgi:hypothetical protein